MEGISRGLCSKGSQLGSVRESEAVTEGGVQAPHFSDGATETHRRPLKGRLEESGFLGQEEATCLRGSVIMRGLWNRILVPQLTDPVALGTLQSFPCSLLRICKMGTGVVPPAGSTCGKGCRKI